MKLRVLGILLIAVSLQARTVRKVYVPPPPPPPVLIQAAGAYMSGEYQQVLELIGNMSFRDRPMEAQRFLFMSAAAYNLFHLQGETDEGLRTVALENARQAHAVGPSLQPSPKVFSPRFIEFYRSIP